MWVYFEWWILYPHSSAMAFTQTWAPAGGRPCVSLSSHCLQFQTQESLKRSYLGARALPPALPLKLCFSSQPLCLSPWTSLHHLLLYFLLLHFFLHQHSCFSTCFSSTTSITFLSSSAAKDGIFLCHHLFSQTTTQGIAWDLYSTVNHMSVGHSSPTRVW